MSRVRLIASDLDGTLLRNDGTISARTLEAIRAAERRGLIFAIVTARPPRGIEILAKSAGLNGLAVCSNGAVLYDLGGQEALHCMALAPATAWELITALRSLSPEIAFAAEHNDKVSYDQNFPGFPGDSSAQVNHLEQLLDGNLVKLLIHHPTHDAETLLDLVSHAVEGRAEAMHSGGATFIEISACGVSKAYGLKRLCESLNVDSADVIAFGDMPNDLPMLRFAGRSIAVANAHPEVLAASDEITASNEDDGVAQAIEALLMTSVAFSGLHPRDN